MKKQDDAQHNLITSEEFVFNIKSF